LAIDPKNVIAIYDKGNALDNLGNHTQAISYIDKALAIDPKDIYALFRKGEILDNMGNHTQAIQYYDKALSIDPNYKNALNGKQTAQSALYSTGSGASMNATNATGG
jgi:tetratricopeptide (TPR) repeat protein